MNQLERSVFKAAIILLLILIALIVLGPIVRPLPPNKESVVIEYKDSLSDKVKALEKTIVLINKQKDSIQKNQSIYQDQYMALIYKINSNQSDSNQYLLLKELTKLSDPKPIDINQQLAGGIYAWAMYRNCDSIHRLEILTNQLKDSVVAFQKTEISERDSVIKCVLNALDKSNKTVLKRTNQKIAWRRAAVIQGVSILAFLGSRFIN